MVRIAPLFAALVLAAAALTAGPALAGATAGRSLACAEDGSAAKEAAAELAVIRAHFTDAEIRDHHAFRRPRWMRALLDQVAQLVLFGVLFLARLDRRLYRACENLAAKVRVPAPLARALGRLWAGDGWLAALLFALAYFFLALAIDFPQAFYFDYLDLKSNGLLTQSPLRYAALFVRDAAGQAAGMSMMAFGLYGLARKTRHWWLLLGVPSALLVAATALLDPAREQLDYRFTPLAAGATRDAVEAILARARVEHAGLFEIDAARDTRALDAFVVGVGPARRIALYDTLVKQLSPREVAAVVAHELGHLSEPRALRLWLAAASILPFLGLLAFGLRKLGRTGRFGFTSDRDPTSLPAAMCLFWLVTTVASPLANTDARRRESKADRYAVDLTADPDAFRAAMVKVARVNKLDLTPPPLIVTLLYSHPAVAERILTADHWAEEHRAAAPAPAGPALQPLQ